VPIDLTAAPTASPIIGPATPIPAFTTTAAPTATSTSGLGGVAPFGQDNFTLGLALISLLLLLILIALLALLLGRRSGSVIAGPAGNAQAQGRNGIYLDVTLAVLSTIAGAIISHFWH
jgi:hypothetical protein